MKLDNKDKVIVGLLIAIVLIFANNFKNNKENEPLIEKASLVEQNIKDIQSTDEETNIKKVHISGEIKNQGVYVINDGDRLEDLVKKAGGLTEEADIDSINLSMILDDQMRIIIPNVNDKTDNNNINQVSVVGSVSNDKININQASKEELMTLPNIGDKRADSIIEYREGKKFETIDDIKNVSGIGEKYFDQMKDLIRTN